MGNQPVVLLASREPILRLGLSSWLEQQGLAQVETTDRPEELQNLLSERLHAGQPLVDLLVLDLEWPDIPLCQSLKRRYPHLPILALGPPPAGTNCCTTSNWGWPPMWSGPPRP